LISIQPPYRDKKVVSVFIRFFDAPLHFGLSGLDIVAWFRYFNLVKKKHSTILWLDYLAECMRYVFEMNNIENTIQLLLLFMTTVFALKVKESGKWKTIWWSKQEAKCVKFEKSGKMYGKVVISWTQSQ
jgi:hypothetical protein